MKLLPLLTSLLFAASAQAGLYRWVDENGVTQYSQTPPPKQDADKLKPPPPPAESPQEARRRLDMQLQEMDDRREDRELAAEERRRENENHRITQENCQRARANLANLETATRRLVRQPDGSYKRLTEEERQAKMREAREILDKDCK